MKSFYEYSEEELLAAKQSLPAVARYLNLIKAEPSSPFEQIRIRRHKAWLKAALAILHDTATAKEVCRQWSLDSLQIIRWAWQECQMDSENLALFALGKLGAHELNLSSDVDLMILAKKPIEEMKGLRLFQKSLQEVTSFGHALRVDLDLRAGGRLGPIISTFSQFQDYYGNFGETWERLAFVRLLPVTGNEELLEQTLQFAKKFTFRKHLDYTLFEDLKNLRGKYHIPSPEDSFHLKLGKGGIRDIELFTHALQVIHGGKDPSLQERETEVSIEKLKMQGALPVEDANFLIESYWKLRDLENRVQVLNDLQTHTLPLKENNFFFEKTSLGELEKIREDVDKTVSTLLGEADDRISTLPESLDLQKEWLAQKGFSEKSVTEVWPDLIQMQVRSRSRQRDEGARKVFLASFIENIEKMALDKDLALSLLKDFTHATRAKASFFTLFNREPELLESLAWLFSTSPYLGNLLSSRPEIVDSFLLRKQEPFSKDFEALLNELSERKLVSELIAANDFLSQKNILMLLFGLSQTADEIVSALYEGVRQKLDANSKLKILTLGKWAGYELGFRSDLDFIFVADGEVSEKEHRFAKQIISQLTAANRGGKLYSIDLRLRPSGAAGPMIVQSSSLKDFLENSAEAWQRQAYSKSRFLGSDEPFAKDFAVKKGLSSDEEKELREIRKKLLEENRPKETKNIDLKYHPGGFVDVEFAVQIALLKNKKSSADVSTLGLLETLSAISPSWNSIQEKLNENYNRLRSWEQFYQLTTRRSGSLLEPESDSFDRLAKLHQLSKEALKEQIFACLNENSELLEAASVD